MVVLQCRAGGLNALVAARLAGVDPPPVLHKRQRHRLHHEQGASGVVGALSWGLPCLCWLDSAMLLHLSC